MKRIQFIEQDGRKVFAVVPIDTYERMLDDLEDLDDVRCYDAAKARQEEYFPSRVVDALLDGVHPIRVFREHRGLSQPALAEACGISVHHLCQLEAGQRSASQDVMRKLAAALTVDIDLLMPTAPEGE